MNEKRTTGYAEEGIAHAWEKRERERERQQGTNSIRCHFAKVNTKRGKRERSNEKVWEQSREGERC